MALRAGYYGVKRFLRNKLMSIASTYDDTIKSLFSRSDQAVLGAKNWFNYTKETTTSNGVTFTNVNNQSCVLSGQSTADQAAIEMGTLSVDKDTEFILNGASASSDFKIHMYVWDGTTGARPYTDSSKTTQQTNNCYGTGVNAEIPFLAEAGHIIRLYARVQTAGTSIPNDTVFYPMIRLSDDPDESYAPYAMTNKQLTDSAADQKTTINAIITAATGAADFAAFKTAMGAITPVTRSLSLTKEDITEEVKEDVEPEKTVTKKRTTKKTEEV